MISFRGHCKGAYSLKRPFVTCAERSRERLNSCRVHGAHRTRIHVAGGNERPVLARRADSLPLYAVPVSKT